MTDSHTLGQSVPKEGLFLLDGIEGLRSLPKHTMLRIFHVVPLTLRGCHAQEYHHVPCKGSCQHPES